MLRVGGPPAAVHSGGEETAPGSGTETSSVPAFRWTAYRTCRRSIILYELAFPVRRARVRPALRAAARRPPAPLVRAALCAAAGRAAAMRREAARLAWRDSAACEAVLRGSFLRTRDTARETRGRRVGLAPAWPAS